MATKQYQTYIKFMDFIIRITPAENKKQAREYITDFNELAYIIGYNNATKILEKLSTITNNKYIKTICKKLAKSKAKYDKRPSEIDFDIFL